MWIVLDESVLHRMIGGSDVMRAQLDHLLMMAQRPQIQLQLLPADVGVHPALHGPFIILRFAASTDPGLVYLESRLGGAYYEDQAEIDEYTAVMNHLRVQSLNQADSVRHIAGRRKELP